MIWLVCSTLLVCVKHVVAPLEPWIIATFVSWSLTILAGSRNEFGVLVLGAIVESWGVTHKVLLWFSLRHKHGSPISCTSLKHPLGCRLVGAELVEATPLFIVAWAKIVFRPLVHLHVVLVISIEFLFIFIPWWFWAKTDLTLGYRLESWKDRVAATSHLLHIASDGIALVIVLDLILIVFGSLSDGFLVLLNVGLCLKLWVDWFVDWVTFLEGHWVRFAHLFSGVLFLGWSCGVVLGFRIDRITMVILPRTRHRCLGRTLGEPPLSRSEHAALRGDLLVSRLLIILSWARCRTFQPILSESPLVCVESGINLVVSLILLCLLLNQTRNGISARSWFLLVGLFVFVAVEAFYCGAEKL